MTLTAVVCVGLAVAMTALAGRTLFKSPTADGKPVRFAFVTPATLPMDTTFGNRTIAISPDHTQIVYRSRSGADVARLVVRSLDRLEVRPLAGTEQPRGQFLSADGRWIGFFSAGELKKVSIDGGPVSSLGQFTGVATGIRDSGASWGQDGNIVFATSDPATGLIRISAEGGEAQILTRPNSAAGESDHIFPAVLPDSRSILFTITSPSKQAEQNQIAVLDLPTGRWKTLIKGAGQAAYVAPGYLVFVSSAAVRAIRFDLGTLAVVGDPVTLVERVLTAPEAAANVSVSQSGSLIYVPEGEETLAMSRSLVWVDRDGREQPIGAPPRAYIATTISPDGRKVALDVRDQDNDIWVWDLVGSTLSRLTFGPAPDRLPVWTPDSRQILFQSGRLGAAALFRQAADGTGVAELLEKAPHSQLIPASMAPDGNHALVADVSGNIADLAVLTLHKEEGAVSSTPAASLAPLVRTSFNEFSGAFSPDGHWFAYQSNETGRFEVHVRAFPNADTGGRWQISTQGGSKPLWARSGRELFFLDAENKLTVVPVTTSTGSFNAGNPRRVLETAYFTPTFERAYDVSPDGQRFLMVKDAAGTATTSSIVVMVNWVEEMKKLLPLK